MADATNDKPQRSAADKERSRQMNRSVSGRDAARAGSRSGGSRQGGGPGGGKRSPQGSGAQARRDAQRQAQQNRNQQGRRGSPKPGSRASQRSRRPGRAVRSRTGLFIWGSVALVVVIVAVLVLVNELSSGTKSGSIYTPKPVPATILSEITHVPASVYNDVGTGIAGTIFIPKVESGQTELKYTTKPGVFGMFGEFCPYCAAERWSIIAAFSRFGTFSGLKTMQSSPSDVYPKTQTFTFTTATYSSPYFDAKLVEYYGQDNAAGEHKVITKLTKQEKKLISKYDYTTEYASKGDIPFLDMGNELISEGVGYNPQPLQGLSRATIAAALSNPNNDVTKLIIADANYLTAGICHIDGGKPGSVCSSKGVQAAAKALGVSS